MWRKRNIHTDSIDISVLKFVYSEQGLDKNMPLLYFPCELLFSCQTHEEISNCNCQKLQCVIYAIGKKKNCRIGYSVFFFYLAPGPIRYMPIFRAHYSLTALLTQPLTTAQPSPLKESKVKLLVFRPTAQKAKKKKWCHRPAPVRRGMPMRMGR